MLGILTGCAGAVTVRPVVNATPLKIMVLGDSISAGCGVHPLTGWCKEFADILDSKEIGYQISAWAISGRSCSSLQPGFKAAFDKAQPNVVVMSCGTNDVPNDGKSKEVMGAAWRTMVEYSWTHGAHVLPVFVGYSNPEINQAAGRGWLVNGEATANDVIYENMKYYQSAGWFVGLADMQIVPGDWNFLNGGTDGIHPNELGAKVMAMLYYRAMRAFYGWPDSVAVPCGMWGHRSGYGPREFVACASVT